VPALEKFAVMLTELEAWLEACVQVFEQSPNKKTSAKPKDRSLFGLVEIGSIFGLPFLRLSRTTNVSDTFLVPAFGF
jgi:hypothetical protein